MNERFLEIAKRARLKFPSETELSPMEEKFAELIVLESIELLNQNAMETGNVTTTVGTVATQLKKHFGIEQ